MSTTETTSAPTTPPATPPASTPAGPRTDTDEIPGADRSAPYVLRRDEGDHRHFLNHLATRKVTAGDSGTLSAVEFVAERGFGPPLHRHDDEDELMFIFDGEIHFRSGDDEFVGREGATVFLPRGVAHTFQVHSNSARFTSVTASASGRPRFDRMVAALGTPLADTNLPAPIEIEPGEVAAACAAHGIDVLGPPPAPLPA